MYNLGMAKKAQERHAGGRPPLPESEKRTLPVEMRVNEEEKQRLLLAAKTSGVPLATWMRMNLLSAATQQLEHRGVHGPLLHGKNE
jgi:hypothetical protein